MAKNSTIISNSLSLPPLSSPPLNAVAGDIYYDVVLGYQFYNGSTWVTGGQVGATGVRGQTGAGINGVTGVAGINGVTGVAGINGVTGVAGINGVTGVAGINGVTGVQGITGSVGSIGALDSQAANANGLALVGSVLSTQSASATQPGLVNTAAQSFAGDKTFGGNVFISGIATGSVVLAETSGQIFGKTGTSGQVLSTNGSSPFFATPVGFTARYVDVIGSDTTGLGTFTAPWATYAHATAAITDNAATKPYVLYLGPGSYSGNITLKPFVYVVGAAPLAGEYYNTSSVTTATYPTTLTGNVLIADGTIGGSSLSYGIANLHILGNFKTFTTTTTAVGTFSIDHCLVNGTLNVGSSNNTTDILSLIVFNSSINGNSFIFEAQITARDSYFASLTMTGYLQGNGNQYASSFYSCALNTILGADDTNGNPPALYLVGCTNSDISLISYSGSSTLQIYTDTGFPAQTLVITGVGNFGVQYLDASVYSVTGGTYTLQGDSTVITVNSNLSPSTSVMLPVGYQGKPIFVVKNDNGSNPVLVYPPAGGGSALNNGAGPVAITSPSQVGIFVSTAGRWVGQPLSAPVAPAGPIFWVESANAPISSVDTSNSLVYQFSSGAGQNLYAQIKVPTSYATGSQVKLKTEFYDADSSGTALLQTVSTLIRPGTDLYTSTTNQRTSTNTAVTLGAGTVNIPQSVVCDLSDTSGNINGVAVAPGSLIIIKLTRGTDTGTSDLFVPVYATEVTFQ